MKRSFVIAGCLVSLLIHSAHADLKWEQTTLELHPNFGDKEAVGHFKYENTGTTPVQIKNVKTSCGCTVAHAEQQEVAPGQKGEITATFNIGNHVGTQVKTVSVTTDQAPTPLTTLVLKAVLPEGMTMTPNFVFWRVGEEPKAKTIVAKAGPGFTPDNVEVKAENPEFTATLEPGSGKKKDKWTITVKPKQTDRNISTLITVKTDFPKQAPQSFFANASVAGAPDQAAAGATQQ